MSLPNERRVNKCTFVCYFSAASKYDAMHRKCLCLMPMSTNSVVKTHQSSCCCLLPPTTSPQEQKHGENIGFLPPKKYPKTKGLTHFQLEALPKGSAKSHWAHKANTFMRYQPVGKAAPCHQKMSLYAVFKEGWYSCYHRSFRCRIPWLAIAL